ncbi:MAG: L-glutamate gamma-semialdehyde dehydrogenase, partial [Planctomycetota bacterium]
MHEHVLGSARPSNEPVLSYAPDSPERAALRAELRAQLAGEREVCAVIGGERVRTGRRRPMVCPHRHRHVLGHYEEADAALTTRAIEAALAAAPAWRATPWHERLAIFERAAELLSGPWRPRLNAATMLDQSKVIVQAEIDAACELIDFWRFNPWFAEQIYREQPRSAPGVRNRVEYRPLEGFVFAVTPFNFTSIQANLPTAAAMMGNVVVWKPAPNAMLAPSYVMELLEEAGLPPGVINLVPGHTEVGEAALVHPELAGIHFTGSVRTFRHFYRTVGEHIERYRSYPRLVGETGGKDFVLVHPSADLEAVHVALIRGAYEYQGQKCSAASRAFVPRSVWPALRDRLVATMAELRMGDVTDPETFLGAVIDERAWKRITAAIERARGEAGYRVVAGGGADASEGWFIEPTLIEADDPGSELMREELFGPVLTVHVYDDARFDEILTVCDRATPYGLTGAVFARDRTVIARATEALAFAAGNFYVNDKPTGAVVDQQPFGGGRL